MLRLVMFNKKAIGFILMMGTVKLEDSPLVLQMHF